MATPEDKPKSHDELEAMLSDYVEGALSEAEAAEVEAHIQSCSECAEAASELGKTVSALASLNRVAAPDEFPNEVAETIRRRSAGRFFGKRTLGDRVPLELLAIVALALALILYFLLRGSETGSLKPFGPEHQRPPIPESSQDILTP